MIPEGLYLSRNEESFEIPCSRWIPFFPPEKKYKLAGNYTKFVFLKFCYFTSIYYINNHKRTKNIPALIK